MTKREALNLLLAHGTSRTHQCSWEVLKAPTKWVGGGYVGADEWVKRCRLCGCVRAFIEAYHSSPEQPVTLSPEEQEQYPRGPDILANAEQLLLSDGGPR